MKCSSIFKGAAAGASLLVLGACNSTTLSGYGGGSPQVYAPPPQAPVAQAVSVTGSPCARGTDIHHFPDVGVAFQQCGNTGVKLGAGPNGFVAQKIYDLGNERDANLFSRDFSNADRRQGMIDQRGVNAARRGTTNRDPIGLDPANEGLRDIGRTTGSINQVINQGNRLLRSLGIN